MASVAEIAPLNTEFDVPSKGPSTGLKKAIEEIAQVIFQRTKISLEGSARAVMPSIPVMLSEIADDIREGSVDRFKISLEKLEKITGKLGIDLGKYNKELAKFLEDREENTIKSEQRIVEIREKGAKAEIDQITGKINVLSREEIKQRTDTLKQVLRDTKKITKAKNKEEKLLQKSAFLSEAEIQVKKEFVSKSYEQLQEMEQRKETLKSTLGIESDEDLPGTGFMGFGGGGGRDRDSGEGIREYVPDFIMNIADEFTGQLQMFAEPFIIMKNVIMDVLKPLKILGKLFGPLIAGFKKLIAQIGRQILVGVMLVATNLLRIMTDKKVLMGMVALGAILGLKKLHDKFKDGPDGPTPGSAGDSAAEFSMTNVNDDLTDEELHKKYDKPYSIFRKRKSESRDADTLKKISSNDAYRTENNKFINENGSMDSKNNNSVIVKNDSALNQKTESNYSSIISAGDQNSVFFDTVEGN